MFMLGWVWHLLPLLRTLVIIIFYPEMRAISKAGDFNIFVSGFTKLVSCKMTLED